MWRDNDDKIMDILDNIEPQKRECFPVVCPICGKKDGHLYFHINREEDERGSMWAWCSTCYPNYLEENKYCIDDWVNKLIFLNIASEK